MTWDSSVLWGMARFLIAIFLALIFLVAARRVILNYFPPAKQDNGASLSECVGAAVGNWLERVLPSAVLLQAGSMIVILFGLGRIEEGLLLIFLWSIFLEWGNHGNDPGHLRPVPARIPDFLSPTILRD